MSETDAAIFILLITLHLMYWVLAVVHERIYWGDPNYLWFCWDSKFDAILSILKIIVPVIWVFGWIISLIPRGIKAWSNLPDTK